MSIKKKEGGFYAAKVRKFLNEYNGEGLAEFCKAEKLSYTKMCNCLGRPSYRRECFPEQESQGERVPESSEIRLLPELELKPLVIDVDDESCEHESIPSQKSEVAATRSSSYYLNGVRLRTSSGIELLIGKCPVPVLAAFVREMEGSLC